jgi:hypothetical protein
LFASIFAQLTTIMSSAFGSANRESFRAALDAAQLPALATAFHAAE